MTYQITNQRELRKAFWQGFEGKVKRLASGDYPTDVRVAFVDYIDSLCRDGVISEALAQRATL